MITRLPIKWACWNSVSSTICVQVSVTNQLKVFLKSWIVATSWARKTLIRPKSAKGLLSGTIYTICFTPTSNRPLKTNKIKARTTERLKRLILALSLSRTKKKLRGKVVRKRKVTPKMKPLQRRTKSKRKKIDRNMRAAISLGLRISTVPKEKATIKKIIF